MNKDKGRQTFLQTLVLLAIGAGLLSGCANPYTKFYQDYAGRMSIARQQRLLPLSSPPQVISVSAQRHRDEGQKLEERGFVILGEAAFVGDAGATEQQMIEQAKKVGAEVVIHTFEYSHSEQGIMPLFSYQPGQTYTTHHSGSVVYGRSYGTYSGTSTATTPGTYHTDYIPYQRQHYDYLASFWRRTRPPIFGVTLNPLPDELRTTLQRNSGAHVVLVVMDSPAFKANILKGDVIVQFADKVVGSFQEILDLLPSHAGQKVKVLAIRGAQTLDIDVQLNE